MIPQKKKKKINECDHGDTPFKGQNVQVQLLSNLFGENFNPTFFPEPNSIIVTINFFEHIESHIAFDMVFNAFILQEIIEMGFDILLQSYFFAK